MLNRKRLHKSIPPHLVRSQHTRSSMTRVNRSSSRLAGIALIGSAGFIVLSAARWWHILSFGAIPVPLLILNGLLELTGVLYSVSVLTISGAYVLSRLDHSPCVPFPSTTRFPPVGIVYLCCDDVNKRALSSLCRLQYPGTLYLIVHDDSTTASARTQVDSIVATIREQFPGQVLLLRRPTKDWGKPGATNYVLAETGHLYQYFVLCDNDSTPLSSDIIQRALPHFVSPGVAIVQFRSTAIVPEGSSHVSAIISQAIEVFDVFITMAPRWGWQPFLGHNAMVSVHAFRAVGGLRPLFADDIDFTLRLNLRGFRVVYAPDIVVGEEHPPSYAAFRARTYKWAYGCTQILKAHGKSILLDPGFSFGERWYLFVLLCFYPIQSLLLLYLVTAHIVLPVFVSPPSPAFWQIIIADSFILVAVLAYTWAYFLKRYRLKGYGRFALLCCLIYGGTGLVSVQAIWDCLRNRKRRWVPTNGIHAARRVNPKLAAEPLLAGAVLVVPLLCTHELAVSPLLYLFLAIYLAVPLVSRFY